MLIVSSSAVGCTPQFYRLSADRETRAILADKMTDPRWHVGPVEIQPPPASRNFDRFNPDRPPMPPDDPAAHVYMHSADGKRGYHGWHARGNAPWVEDPCWRESLGLSEDGVLVLDPGRAVRLALLNSREYQFQLEQLYLAALALTLERFEFDLHWYGRNTTQYEHFGSGSTPTESNALTSSSNLGFTRAFSAGGQLLVDFANTFVWEFTGSDTNASFSNLTVELVQPLLRGAGRDIRLESLTQSERDVLYAVRDFARFRKQFYFDVISGDGGYLSLLLQVQSISNLEANLASLQNNLRAHEALARADIVSPIQVDQVFQSYQSGRLRLIRARNNLESALDTYKTQLGLPPDLEARLEDSLLAPFQLNSPEVAGLGDALEQLLVQFRELDQPPPEDQLRGGFHSLESLHQRLLEQIAQVRQELDRWKSQPQPAGSAAPEPMELEREVKAQALLTQRLAELQKDAQARSQEIAQALQAVDSQAPEASWEGIQDLIRRESAHASDLFVVQTQIRAYLVELPTAEYEQSELIAQALSQRLDLMNRQAEVVDAWRGIRVAANGLESDLDVVLNADIATEPGSDNPLDFSAQASQYRVGLRLDGPLNRLAERNAYRAQLIAYQQARRSFMASRDAIVRAIRRDLRDLSADRLNFEISRQSLIAAARQVELARIQLLAPGQTGDSSTTQDALDALNSMLDAKDALIGIWVAFETDRLRLLLDTESLQLDERGPQDLLGGNSKSKVEQTEPEPKPADTKPPAIKPADAPAPQPRPAPNLTPAPLVQPAAAHQNG